MCPGNDGWDGGKVEAERGSERGRESRFGVWESWHGSVGGGIVGL